MYKLAVQTRFSAAHFLREYPGVCARIHGHNWLVKVIVTAPDIDKNGMVVDLVALKKHIDECVNQFDHRIINEVPPFDRLNPTSENLAKYLYDYIVARTAVTVASVEVAEADYCSVIYEPKNLK
jgi:6-pyruvoyltetrahydropterin/6-carboxytetrahydropterin synthase